VSPPQSHALHELDLRLDQHLGIRNGFFIEAGANDGIAQSNTLFLERCRGWRGMLVEAIPELARRCRENRPTAIVEHAALVAFDFQPRTIDMRYCGLMSLVVGAMGDAAREHDHIQLGVELQGTEPYDVSVPAATLSSLIERHGIERIDLLSLDVEGYELNVLRGLDLERHGPHAILVEAWDRSGIDDHLGGSYDRVAELTEDGREVRGRAMAADVLYVRRRAARRRRRRQVRWPLGSGFAGRGAGRGSSGTKSRPDGSGSRRRPS
jgi:FkbM family methyltransferase